jgi:GDP-4-dehydro-6-deoxy-D-mannose reductase
VTRLPLVTGATGFAGSHLLDLFVEEGQAVSAWANPGGKRPPEDGHPLVTWKPVDVLDAAAVADAIAALRPSVIYHTAGAANVGSAWRRPADALRLNALGTHHVLEAVRVSRLDCAVLVTGSALVYRQSAEALTEGSPLSPATPYGVTKLAQEMVGARATWCPVLLARPFNHVGPRQSPSYVTSSFARQIAEIEAGLHEPVLRVGNLDSRRDITDVRDTVRAYRRMVQSGTPGQPYNVCAGQAYRVADLLDRLIEMSSVHVRVEVDLTRLRPSDTPVLLGDASRLHADTGWRPAIPIERTLADLLAFWRQETKRAAAPRP